ncbi:Uncharacterised protein [Candidatus Tiddalikarchaeum anstoanum]|nr:Uncharacterised protein [Candidatus Tiddalikarchaeum anstoanum]
MTAEIKTISHRGSIEDFIKDSFNINCEKAVERDINPLRDFWPKWDVYLKDGQRKILVKYDDESRVSNVKYAYDTIRERKILNVPDIEIHNNFVLKDYIEGQTFDELFNEYESKKLHTDFKEYCTVFRSKYNFLRDFDCFIIKELRMNEKAQNEFITSIKNSLFLEDGSSRLKLKIDDYNNGNGEYFINDEFYSSGVAVTLGLQLSNLFLKTKKETARTKRDYINKMNRRSELVYNTEGLIELSEKSMAFIDEVRKYDEFGRYNSLCGIDLKPENIVIGKDGKIYFIDLDSFNIQDSICDLAIINNFRKDVYCKVDTNVYMTKVHADDLASLKESLHNEVKTYDIDLFNRDMMRSYAAFLKENGEVPILPLSTLPQAFGYYEGLRAALFGLIHRNEITEQIMRDKKTPLEFMAAPLLEDYEVNAAVDDFKIRYGNHLEVILSDDKSWQIIRTPSDVFYISQKNVRKNVPIVLSRNMLLYNTTEPLIRLLTSNYFKNYDFEVNTWHYEESAKIIDADPLFKWKMNFLKQEFKKAGLLKYKPLVNEEDLKLFRGLEIGESMWLNRLDDNNTLVSNKNDYLTAKQFDFNVRVDCWMYLPIQHFGLFQHVKVDPFLEEKIIHFNRPPVFNKSEKSYDLFAARNGPGSIKGDHIITWDDIFDNLTIKN